MPRQNKKIPSRATGKFGLEQNASERDGRDFISETVAVWQKQTKRVLTREDGRQIAENMMGFFRVLQEWDRADRMKNSLKRR
jgi:hypothetical protein